jgi:hypothetical protein
VRLFYLHVLIVLMSPWGQKNAADLVLFTAIQASIEKNYGDEGKPRWAADQEESRKDWRNTCLRVLTKTQYQDLSQEEIQDILRFQHIVVPGYDQKTLRFDRNGLSTLGGLKIRRSIHGKHPFDCLNLGSEMVTLDQSVEPTDVDPNATESIGNLLQLKESHEHNGKILNALDLSMPVGNEPPYGISSDREAFRCTLDGQLCRKKVLYPSTDMSWGLAGTSGAISYFHIDADGFMTWLVVKAGLKYWILANPRDASLSTYDFHPRDFDPNKWPIEAILLHPGDLLCVYSL